MHEKCILQFPKTPQIAKKYFLMKNKELPLGNFLRKHGSSEPEGDTMQAFNDLKSQSEIFCGNETSEADPTEIALRFLPSPVTLQVKGEPSMCSPANRALILYSPGAVGRQDTLTVPSLLSMQLISALLGPSTAKASPPAPAPEEKKNELKHTMHTKDVFFSDSAIHFSNLQNIFQIT